MGNVESVSNRETHKIVIREHSLLSPFIFFAIEYFLCLNGTVFAVPLE